MASREKLLGMGVVAAMAIGMTGCQNGEYVRWDESGAPARINPRTNEAIYEYVYYPDVQVYFQPYSEMYWWFQDGAWYEGNVLPEGLSVRQQYFEFVRLDSPQPWTHHVTVQSGFGRKLLPGSVNPDNYEMEPTMEITVVDPASVYE